ncbi:MAG: hypothetical protein HYY06_10775 [Deltaproteobacteria bacterium]|nr:hypothetical protein [Deltaproteobacteria bacterium]
MKRPSLLLLCLPSLAAAGCSGGDMTESEATTESILASTAETDVAAAPGQPPAAALDACADLAADAACSISIDGHSIDGTCRRGPGADDPLACAPAHLPPMPHRPPREALDACADLAADAACSISIAGHSIDGACRRGPGADDPLACAPPHLPPLSLGPPREALDACAELDADATCSFAIDGHSIDGACRRGPGAGDPLACAPARLPHPPLPPREAVDACAALPRGSACDFDLGGQSLGGTCWSPDPLAPLACAPAGAPIP